MRSIRREMTVLLVLGQTVLVGAVGAGVWWLGSRSLTDAFDARLDERVRTLATLVYQEGPLIDLEFSEQLMPGYSRAVDPEYFQVWIVDAGVLERSDTLGDDQLEEPEVRIDEVVHSDTVLPDGRNGRRASFSLPIHEYEPLDDLGRTASRRTTSIVVALGRGPLERQLAALGLGLLGMGLVLVTGNALLIRWILRRGLAPIGVFADRIAAVEHPHQRADLAAMAAPLEVAPITTGVDRMLQRLGAAFDRERRLSGNIAHELRTPVAELRTTMDVVLLSPEDTEGLRRAAHEARDIAGEMEATIAALLRVWRREQDADQALGTSSMGTAIDSALGAVEDAARNRELRIERDAAESLASDELVVAVAERPLQLVVGNLVKNAAAHATTHSTVQWDSRRTEDRAIFTISNDHAHDITAEDVALPHFTTGRIEEHSGLGLSLSRALCDASGMDLELEVTPSRFVATLSAPLP